MLNKWKRRIQGGCSSCNGSSLEWDPKPFNKDDLVVVASARGLRTSGLGLSSELNKLGGMGRYTAINRLRRRDVAMEEDGSSFHLFFQMRKIAQSR